MLKFKIVKRFTVQSIFFLFSLKTISNSFMDFIYKTKKKSTLMIIGIVTYELMQFI